MGADCNACGCFVASPCVVVFVLLTVVCSSECFWWLWQSSFVPTGLRFCSASECLCLYWFIYRFFCGTVASVPTTAVRFTTVIRWFPCGSVDVVPTVPVRSSAVIRFSCGSAFGSFVAVVHAPVVAKSAGSFSYKVCDCFSACPGVCCGELILCYEWLFVFRRLAGSVY